MSRRDREDRRLGLTESITRRDFVSGSLVGSGLALLGMSPPLRAATAPAATEAALWNGYAGVGDYARSNGNTWAVRESAHLIRDGKVDALLAGAVEDGESYDVVVGGGGFAGMAAARTFVREARAGQRCLVLENHALVGGEAKRNEFVVDGHRILGPQGSNLSVPPSVRGDWYDALWDDLGIPRRPQFQRLTGHAGELRIARSNFFAMFGIGDQTIDSGYYFDARTFGGRSRWDVNSRATGFRNTPFAARVQEELRQLDAGLGRNPAGDDWARWLDGMSYSDYLEKVLGISEATIRLLDPTLCVEGGLGSDSLSALFAAKVAQPGFDREFPAELSLYRTRATRPEDIPAWSFPGGNDAVFRLLLKRTIPEAIEGGSTFEEVHDGAYRFENFDRAGQPVRVRLESSVLHVAHDGPAERSSAVVITYRHGGQLRRVRARAFVSCMGGWVNKHVVRDLPERYATAYGELNYGSAMIVNVALRNWRFLAKLGVSAVHFFSDDGLGQTANIRNPMVFGQHRPPLDPRKPIVLTLYVGFRTRGLPVRAQAAKARTELLAKSYRDHEVDIRRRLQEMFAAYGFDARRDIAGIVLNRWGHSYVVPEPGFYFGRDGRPTLREVVERPHGRITFAHSEINGIQEWFGAAEHGDRAMRQALALA